MVFLVYEANSGKVKGIYSDKPVGLLDGECVAKSESFKCGDEFEKMIWIQELDENGFVYSYCTTIIAPPVTEILMKNNQLQIQINQLILMLGDVLLGGM